ncbi:hypothetical protein MASR2M15_27180 [Anaerolineales bacterium]
MRYLAICLVSLCLMVSTGWAQEETIPAAMPEIDRYGDDIVNILLIGNATIYPENVGLTDALVILSINRSQQTVSFISLPRDLWVYVPDYGMAKINQAMYFGNYKIEGGDGITSLKKTILYNLGVPIDFYAKINFSLFKSLIDSLGGVTVPVDCAIKDWRLISPELDITEAENYEMFILPAGVHHMHGDTALWYVRSRKSSTDLDRNRRQQDLLRAIWRRIASKNLLSQLPELWASVQDQVETDMGFDDVLGFAPFALTFDVGNVRQYVFRQKQEITSGYNNLGQYIFSMDPEAVQAFLQGAIRPALVRQIKAYRPQVAVVNTSDWGAIATIAIDRLTQEGFDPVLIEEEVHPSFYTRLVDYAGISKNNPAEALIKLFRLGEEQIEVDPDPDRDFDYKVYLGQDYINRACTRQVIQPSWEEIQSFLQSR